MALLIWTLLLLIYGGQVTLAEFWEVKTSAGLSYRPQRYAISLLDHNAAFLSSEYCMDNNDENKSSIMGYVRELCDQCPTCVWKKRGGFTTEAEWQISVTIEMERLERDEVPGTWIVEAPFHMPLNDTKIDDLASSLGISMENSPIISDMGDRSYFMISGTSTRVHSMLSAGFISVTPIPPRLKVEPLLEEEATAGASSNAGAAPSTTSGMLRASSSSQQAAIHGLHVHLAPPPPPPPGLVFAARSVNATAAATAGASSHSQRLSALWASVISTRLGHDKATVVAEAGDHHITVKGLANSAELYLAALDIATHGEVKWISRQSRVVSSNLFASQLVQSGRWWIPEAIGADEIPDSYHPLSALGLTGKGEVVGVADTGLDWNSCFFRDEKVTPEFKWDEAKRRLNRPKGLYEIWAKKKHRKIRQYVAYMNAEEDEDVGHGTHVCGSIAGRAADPLEELISNDYHGVAPDAKIAFFDTYSKSEPEASGLPSDLSKNVFRHAYRVGARIYVLSFNEVHQRGVRSMSSMAREIDNYCYEHEEFIVFLSAGNTNAERDTTTTLASPAESKSAAVTVGSHYNPDREAGPPPVESSGLRIAPHSAMGPTYDGRIKPDVCGPGNSVYSTASSDSKSCSTAPKDGTSSANAIVAGAAVLVRQYFTRGYYPHGVKNKLTGGFTPMGALLKAVLVNSGQRLDIGGTDHWTDDELAAPDNAQGWGGVNLKSTLVTPSSHPDLRLKVYGKAVGLTTSAPAVYGTGGLTRYLIKIHAERSGLPLKVTLVWYDRPAALNARKALVNDLDLIVVEIGRKVHYANGNTKRDNMNTVEHIEIPNPTPGGHYAIKVQARSLPHNYLQMYALVISGPFDDKNVEKMEHIGGNTYYDSTRTA